MKYRTVKRALAVSLAAVMTAGMLSGCGKKTETNEKGERSCRTCLVPGW